MYSPKENMGFAVELAYFGYTFNHSPPCDFFLSYLLKPAQQDFLAKKPIAYKQSSERWLS